MENLLSDIVKLRACIAYMGEKAQIGWWQSSFLSSSAEAFLSPVFPKTSTLARLNGACGAAQLVHDEHIGIGDVHHLFRLPEKIEHDISQLLVKDSTALDLVTSEEVARAALKELSAGEKTSGLGPHLLKGDAIDETMIRCMASTYLHGFNSGEQVYPYYRGTK